MIAAAQHDSLPREVQRFEGVVAKHESRYDVALLQSWRELTAKPYLVAGRSAIIIDTLRNSSAITVALAAGATDVVLYGKGEDGLQALQRDASSYAGPKVLAGEVEGQPIPGFDLGNSPLEFTPDRVAGNRVFYASTNNGNALEHLLQIEGTRSIMWACMLNGTAVGAAIAAGAIELPLLFLCAGFRGTLAYEDLLCAGQVLLAAQHCVGRPLGTLDDGATVAIRLAADHFTSGGDVKDPTLLASEMADWRCGSVLSLLGQTHDINATICGAGLKEDVLGDSRCCIPSLDRSVAPPRICRKGFSMGQWQD